MNSSTRVFVVGATAILVLDVLGAVASRSLGFPYSALTPGSFAIYGISAFFAARGRTFASGVLVGAGVALVEATIGWAASWTIGPGRPAEGYEGMGPIVVTVVIVTVTGALFGLIGAGVASVLKRRAAASHL